MTSAGGCSKYDGLISIHQHAILDMGSYGAREYDFFQVTALADEVLHRVAVRDAHHVLLDDRPIVEDFGDVMAGRADQLDAAFERLMVGASAHKSWKEGVMNVDNALRVSVHEIVRQNLHVARQHHEIGLVLVNQALDLAFSRLLVIFRHRNDDVGNLVKIGDGLIVRMIRDDQRNFAGELTALMAIEQIYQ